MMNLNVILSLTFVLIFMGCFGQKKHLSAYVNPFIGASTNAERSHGDGFGKTFPGAATPFGLVQLSPNTITGGDNGSGYSYEHKTIEGFAFTQMSGIGWYGDLGNFLVMPTTGALKTYSGEENISESGYRSHYSKESEIASAGYYGVTLTDYGIRAEMAAAPHSGIMRFTFSANKQSRIQIDLARRVGGTSVLQYINVVDDHTIQGWMKCTPEGGGWGNGDGNPNYVVYFYAQFSKPFTNTGIWSANIPDEWKRKIDDVKSGPYKKAIAEASVYHHIREMTGKHLGFYTEFETKDQEQVILKAGISFVSMEGAKKNLEVEIKNWDLDGVHKNALKLWNNALDKMTVEGGTEEEKIVFYTSLYHAMIDPRSFADIDGNYPGGDGKIHQSSGFTKRTIFSGWDVFRSQFPLQTIINPEVVSDMINSLVTLADESRHDYLERWEFLNAYSGCMVGNPAISVIADAYTKGIRSFDIEKAYDCCKKTVELFGNGEKGYVADRKGISKTLEYAYAEWCVSKLAHCLNKPEDEKRYNQRAQSYRNIFDSSDSVQWFRTKKEDGTWGRWTEQGKLEWSGCVESNVYQQGWFVPHDIPGMVKLMGGTKKVITDLTSFFSKTPENMLWNQYYNHANEIVHTVPFLFNHVGTPWLTQKWTRIICERAYHNSVEGLVGNEDVGQMSAWYVLSASGIHQICPGETRFEITSPVFSKITIRLDSQYAKGKRFTIVARNNSAKNVYIQSATLNGKLWNKCWIDYSQIASGGILELEMGNHPNERWGLK